MIEHIKDIQLSKRIWDMSTPQICTPDDLLNMAYKNPLVQQWIVAWRRGYASWPDMCMNLAFALAKHVEELNALLLKKAQNTTFWVEEHKT